MLEFKVLGALLITVGLMFVLKLDPIDFIDLLTRPFQKRQQLRDRVNRITGKKPGVIKRQLLNANEMLNSANMGGKVRHYQASGLLLAFIGFTIGMLLENMAAAIVLALGLALIPLIVIQVRTGNYIRHVNEMMETALSAVTSAYVQSGDLIGAVQSSIKSIPAPIDDYFRRFLVDVEMIDANVVQAIHNLSDKIDRRHFKEWCSVLIQCQGDRELRYALPGIVERLSDMRQTQMKADTAMKRQFVDYGLIVGILLGCIPIMAIMLPGWFDALMYSLPGKVTLTVVILAVFLNTIMVVQTNKPIDMD